jgi:hypothetical protein
MKLLPGGAPNCCEPSHAMLIRPGETTLWCALPDNGTDFTLAELQEAVGGSIKTVPLAGMPSRPTRRTEMAAAEATTHVATPEATATAPVAASCRECPLQRTMGRYTGSQILPAVQVRDAMTLRVAVWGKKRI